MSSSGFTCACGDSSEDHDGFGACQARKPNGFTCNCAKLRADTEEAAHDRHVKVLQRRADRLPPQDTERDMWLLATPPSGQTTVNAKQYEELRQFAIKLARRAQPREFPASEAAQVRVEYGSRERRDGVYWYRGDAVHKGIISAVEDERRRVGTGEGPTPIMPSWSEEPIDV